MRCISPKNRSYNSWDTAIFVHGDLDLQLQDQMIVRFSYARQDAIIMVEIVLELVQV